MSSDLVPVRRRWRDRRPAPDMRQGWYSDRLRLPGQMVLPDGHDYGPDLAEMYSTGRVPEVKAGPVPAWLRHGWGGYAFSVFAMAVIGTVVVFARDEWTLGLVMGWVFGVGGPAALLCIGQSCVRAWWLRAETVRWLADESRQRLAPDPDRSEASAVWQRAMRAVLRVHQVAGVEAAQGLHSHLRELYPLVCRMHDLAKVGVDNLARMPAQKADYDQVQAEAEAMIGALLGDADVTLAARTRAGAEWQPDGAALPEPQLVKVDELR